MLPSENKNQHKKQTQETHEFVWRGVMNQKSDLYIYREICIDPLLFYFHLRCRRYWSVCSGIIERRDDASIP